MAAITLTTVNLIGTESRAISNRARTPSGRDTDLVPIRVSSGTSGTTSTDTATLTLDSRTRAILVVIQSTTGTITTGSSLALSSLDTVGFKFQAVAAGNVLSSPILPVMGGNTIVLTTGTLATAGSVVIIYQFAPRYTFNSDVV